jgi:hypothetical protein
MAALNRFDVGRLNEVLAIFAHFVKSAEGNSVSYYDIFPMLQQLIANRGSLPAKNHTETLVKAVSERFSRTRDLNIMFTCFLVTPYGERYYSHFPRPDAFAASMKAMCNHGIATLPTTFSDNVAQMTDLFQNYRDHPRQFGSATDLCANLPRFLSISDRQFDTGPFVVKRRKYFSRNRVRM